MITVPEAAARTGLAPETIRRWIRAGKLAATKVGTQHLVDERDLSALTGDARAPAPAYRADVRADVDPQLRRRIVADRSVLGGKPVVRGTRITVELVLELLAAGWTGEEVLEAYRHLTRDDVRACIAYAAERLHDEHVYPIP